MRRSTLVLTALSIFAFSTATALAVPAPGVTFVNGAGVQVTTEQTIRIARQCRVKMDSAGLKPQEKIYHDMLDNCLAHQAWLTGLDGHFKISFKPDLP